MDNYKKYSASRFLLKIAIYSYLFNRFVFDQFSDYTADYRKFSLQELNKAWKPSETQETH